MLAGALAGRSATTLVVMTAENRAPIRKLPAALGAALHRRRHLRADDGRRGRRAWRCAAACPWSHALASFLTLRAFEFIRTDVGIPRLPVKLVGFVPGLPLGGQRPDPPGDRRRGADARHPRHAGVLPGGREELVAALPAILASRAPDLHPLQRRAAGRRAREPFVLGRAEVARRASEGVAILTLRLPAARGRCARARLLRGARRPRAARQPAHASSRSTRRRSWTRPAPARAVVTVEDHFATGGLLHDPGRDAARARGSAAACSPIDLGGAGSARRCCPTCSSTRASPARASRTASSDALCRTAGGRAAPRPDDGEPRSLPDDHALRRALRARAGPDPRAAPRRWPRAPASTCAASRPSTSQRGRGAHVVGRRRQRVPRLQHGGRSARRSATRYPAVDAAIRAQLEDGITFSLMHPLEVEVAELVREVVPGAESVRFSKTGCDVTSAAVRLARAFTGRDKVLCCGYHGWHDWYIATTDRARGVPGGGPRAELHLPLQRPRGGARRDRRRRPPA